MSTELATINGRYEDPNPSLRKSEYLDTEMHLTSFSGEDGPMIQITLGGFPANDHIQLNTKQVRDLLNAIKSWL